MDIDFTITYDTKSDSFTRNHSTVGMNDTRTYEHFVAHKTYAMRMIRTTQKKIHNACLRIRAFERISGMRITLPDQTVKEYDQPVDAATVAADIGAGLAKAAIGAKINGQMIDLNRPIDHDAAIEIITKPRADKKGLSKGEPNPDALYLLRHSCAHVMAEAITQLWPDAQLAYGPPVDNGFYYDIALDTPISSDDFPRIEAEMAKIVAEDRDFKRYDVSPQLGFKKLQREGNTYKLDNAQRAMDAGATTLSWYVTGDLGVSVIMTPGGEEILLELPGGFACSRLEKNGTSYSVPHHLRISDDEISEPFEDCPPNRKHKPDWEDLCMGPHLPSTGHIGAFKVTSIATSHWHGDVNSDRFQRVYGTAFFTPADLDQHLQLLEEAKQRDHRVLGHKLGLFAIDEQVGPGLILWKPRGAMVRTLLQDFLQHELFRRGYDVVYTPHIGKIDLYKTSGHYPFYSDSQFPPIKMRDRAPGGCCDDASGGDVSGDGEEYLLRPMNCPHHIKIFASDPHSFRDLPVRLAEFGTVYRFEQSGELTGMTRVRGFTQDDAHIFCTPDQVKSEFQSTVELVQMVFKTFGFNDVHIRLSLRAPADGSDNDDKYAGSPQVWERAERELREVLTEMGLSFSEEPGEAAFYGPKVDFVVRDVIGRKWQLGTVQLDYNLPERFKLEYVGSDNKPHRPVMIHRAPFGSMERFMAILIEHYAGAFPLWLAPEQIRVLPISEKFDAYGQKVLDALKNASGTAGGDGPHGFRATFDQSTGRVQAKIKVAQELKIPYMLVVGGRDEQASTVSVRDRAKGDLGAMPLETFIQQAQKEVQTRGQSVVTV